MTAIALRQTTAIRPSRAVVVVASGAAFALRWTQLHAGLLYPDGYQYLLSARGIAEHGRPFTRLGPGGDLFVPSADAAAKPLFPLLIALGHLLGFSLRGSANAITATAAAAVPVLCAALVLRLTGSRLGAAVAFGVCLASPTASYWWGFAGPDALAAALGLAAALALVWQRPWLGGILAGAAIATRPELAMLAAAGALAGIADARTRLAALRAGATCAATLATVWLAVRPPVSLPPTTLVVTGAASCVVAAALVVLASRRLVCLGAGAALVATLSLSPGATTWLRGDWPLGVLAAAAAFSLLAARTQLRPTGTVLVAGAALASVYHAKNPSSDRYLAALVPLLALLVGFGASRLRLAAVRRQALVAVTAGVAVAVLALSSAHRAPGPDAFAALAPKLTDDPGLPLVTAAPDAFGFLLPDRTIRDLRPGAKGLVLLDGAQRVYDPRLTAIGSLVATFDQAVFARPDGSLDHGDLRLVDGSVVQQSG
jgi:hypothetical protein